MSRYQIKIITDESIQIIDTDNLTTDLRDYILQLVDDLDKQDLKATIVLSQATLN